MNDADQKKLDGAIFAGFFYILRSRKFARGEDLMDICHTLLLRSCVKLGIQPQAPQNAWLRTQIRLVMIVLGAIILAALLAAIGLLSFIKMIF